MALVSDLSELNLRYTEIIIRTANFTGVVNFRQCLQVLPQ